VTISFFGQKLHKAAAAACKLACLAIAIAPLAFGQISPKASQRFFRDAENKAFHRHCIAAFATRVCVNSNPT
jgi:hypothetical protein